MAMTRCAVANDLHARVTAAVHYALRELNNSGTARDIAFHHSERLADAVVKALGDTEVQWATVCEGHVYQSPEHTARYRARNPGHQLKTRRIIALDDWHDPDSKETPS
jgi:hypothetical protein